MTKTTIFHALHHAERPLILPNAWDFGSAALLAAAGFPAIGTTSLGVAVAAGLPDGTGVTRAETRTVATRLARLEVPVTVDVEGGFSEDPAEVAEFVGQLAELGIAGVNLEDGRGDSTLAEPGHQAELIAAIKARAPEVFVNARVDTYWLKRDQDSTLARAQRYAAAGADGLFVPGMTGTTEIGKFVAAVPVPVNMLFQATGPSIATLADLGVRRVSTGSLLYRAALGAAVEIADAVREGRPITADIANYRQISALTEAPAEQ
ncbi:isocitrate lyase/phosphoenolpyruvate mutase family protein [Nocardia sp. NPDC052566]|uniref:isocitrate lyase/phosphoenolpyruvate mutase family protein n=1 Tax=Nocardia sp. NPDC052566 TaxID=3364330 RepID=UPI0037C72ED3